MSPVAARAFGPIFRLVQTYVKRTVGAVLAGALMVAMPACGQSGTDPWVTTEDTRVDIDWDAVSAAYKEAEGPEDFETKVNEIYAGEEVISVSVHDVDEKTQEVTGFFDKDEDGKVGEEEKVFTIKREITGEKEGNYQIAGHGAYAGYHSPIFDIAAGMLIGSMISRAFMPGYSPMSYTTPASRRGDLVSQRNAYRQANPDKFRAGQRSQSGRQYGRQGGGFGGGQAPARGGGMPRGGGRFGLARSATRRVVHVEA
jgi:hypothetical protein